VQSFCGICHSTTYITMQPPLTSATWEAVVNKMVARSAHDPRTFGTGHHRVSEEPLHSRDAEGIAGKDLDHVIAAWHRRRPL